MLGESQIVNIGAIIGLICAGGILLAVVLPFLTTLFTFVSSLLEFLFDVLAGGPVAWIGCFLLAVLIVGCCGLVAVLVYTYSTCGTPNQVNFCTWFGM